ncbi:MAG: hypothetical protein QG608_1616, partial [Actinomycetota bacterium]|nr:hypothetical protein [Actinomycetota bacterium]
MPACLSNLTLPAIDQPADPQVCPDVT